MKIFFFVGDLSSNGGIERVTTSLANALSTDADTTIVSLYKSPVIEAFETLPKVKVIYLSSSYELSMYNRKLGFIRDAYFDIRYINDKRAIIKNKINNIKSGDVIVSCDVKMTMLLMPIAKFNNAKLIAIEHFEHDIGGFITRVIRRLTYPKIDAVVSLTPEDRHKYLKWLQAVKHYVIPNIVESEIPLHSGERQNVVLSIGRLTKQKGFDLLLNAWSITQTKNWRLRIVGSGDEENELKKLAENLKLKNVDFLPFQKEINIEYSNAKIFVLSSRFEGLGMVILEALSNGLACISFSCPAGPSTILSKNNGILVEAENIQALSKAITVLIDDDDLREHYSLIGPGSIEDYKKDHVVNKWNALLHKI